MSLTTTLIGWAMKLPPATRSDLVCQVDLRVRKRSPTLAALRDQLSTTNTAGSNTEAVGEIRAASSGI
jgi:hypothetical protein